MRDDWDEQTDVTPTSAGSRLYLPLRPDPDPAFDTLDDQLAVPTTPRAPRLARGSVPPPVATSDERNPLLVLCVGGGIAFAIGATLALLS